MSFYSLTFSYGEKDVFNNGFFYFEVEKTGNTIIVVEILISFASVAAIGIPSAISQADMHSLMVLLSLLRHLDQLL